MLINSFCWLQAYFLNMGDLAVDWANGLPDDVLALVAKAGGLPDMKIMREVCTTWQSGFELGVKCIKLPEDSQMKCSLSQLSSKPLRTSLGSSASPGLPA